MLLEGQNLGALVNMGGVRYRLKSKGDFKKTEKFLMKMSKWSARAVLEKYGQKGVEALASGTPVLTGATASAWSYEIEGGEGNWRIVWTNSNINKNVNIAIIIQYGHGTRNGGYVQGRDYINPALQPIFDGFVDEIWEEVTRS